MRRAIAAVAAVASVAMVLATPAWADNPHFIKTSGTLNSGGDYIATWKEAGLGSNPVNYQLTANASFTYQCYTKSNNQPQGDPNSTSFSNYASPIATYSPRNGSISGSIMLEATSQGAGCQGGGLKLCLTAVSYTNVVLHDLDTPLDTSLPNRSATFSAPTPATCVA